MFFKLVVELFALDTQTSTLVIIALELIMGGVANEFS